MRTIGMVRATKIGLQNLAYNIRRLVMLGTARRGMKLGPFAVLKPKQRPEKEAVEDGKLNRKQDPTRIVPNQASKSTIDSPTVGCRVTARRFSSG